METQFLSVDDTSIYLNLKKPTLYSLVESRRIPHYRFGRLIRFKRNELDEWIEDHKVNKIDTPERAMDILRGIKSGDMNINGIVKKALAETQEKQYTPNHGRPDRIRGLGKEVKDEFV